MVYLRLVWDFFKTGAVSFGGGYAMLPLMENVLVGAWLTQKQFNDILAVSQATPGPFSVNAATYTGFLAAPKPYLGAFLATAGLALPSFALCLAAGKFFAAFKNSFLLKAFFNGLRPAAAALIVGAGLNILQGELWPMADSLQAMPANLPRINLKAAAIFIACFAAAPKVPFNTAWLIFMAAGAGFALSFLS